VPEPITAAAFANRSPRSVARLFDLAIMIDLFPFERLASSHRESRSWRLIIETIFYNMIDRKTGSMA